MCAKQVAVQADDVRFTVLSLDGVSFDFVDSKDLHKSLSVGRAHAHWIADRIDRLGLSRDADYRETSRGGSQRAWTTVFLTPKAALRIALAHQPFRGVNTAGKKELLRQRDALAEALLDMRPELRKVLHYEQQVKLSRDERAKLMGWTALEWDAALDNLKSLGLPF